MPIAPFTGQSWLFVRRWTCHSSCAWRTAASARCAPNRCPARHPAPPRRSSPPTTRATRPAPTCTTPTRSTRRSTSRLPPATACSRRTADAWSRSRPTRPVHAETSPSTITRGASGSSRSTTTSPTSPCAGRLRPEGHAVRDGVRRARRDAPSLRAVGSRRPRGSRCARVARRQRPRAARPDAGALRREQRTMADDEWPTGRSRPVGGTRAAPHRALLHRHVRGRHDDRPARTPVPADDNRRAGRGRPAARRLPANVDCTLWSRSPRSGASTSSRRSSSPSPSSAQPFRHTRRKEERLRPPPQPPATAPPPALAREPCPGHARQQHALRRRRPGTERRRRTREASRPAASRRWLPARELSVTRSDSVAACGCERRTRGGRGRRPDRTRRRQARAPGGVRRERLRGEPRARRPVVHDWRPQRRVAGDAYEHEPRDDRVLGLPRARDYPLHPAAEQIRAYLPAYARPFGVTDRIRLRTPVGRVAPPGRSTASV